MESGLDGNLLRWGWRWEVLLLVFSLVGLCGSKYFFFGFGLMFALQYNGFRGACLAEVVLHFIAPVRCVFERSVFKRSVICFESKEEKLRWTLRQMDTAKVFYVFVHL